MGMLHVTCYSFKYFTIKYMRKPCGPLKERGSKPTQPTLYSGPRIVKCSSYGQSRMGVSGEPVSVKWP